MVKTIEFFHKKSLKLKNRADDAGSGCSLFKKTPNVNNHSRISYHPIFCYQIWIMTSGKQRILIIQSLFTAENRANYFIRPLYKDYFLRTLIYLCFQTGSLRTDLGIHTLIANNICSKKFYFWSINNKW